MASSPVLETGSKTPDQRPVILEPQKHGGALLRSKAINHVPGPGRPTELSRELARLTFDDARRHIQAMLDKHESGEAELGPDQLVRVWDVAGKYGIGVKNEVVYTPKRTLQAACEILAELGIAEDIFEAFSEAFSKRLMGKMEAIEVPDESEEA